MLYAEVAVDTEAPYRQAFTYAIPEGLSVQPGQGVVVPFGPRSLQGVILSLSTTPSFDGQVRPVASLAGEMPLVLPHLIDLARWLCNRYLAPLYSCVALMLPPGVERKTRVWLVPTGTGDAVTETQRALLDALREDPTADLNHLQHQLGVSRLSAVVDQLMRRGVLRRDYSLDPPSIGPRFERRLRLTDTARARARSETLVSQLKDAGGSLPLAALRRHSGWSDATARMLMEAGLVEEVEVRADRDPLAGREFPLRPAPVLTAAQELALERVLGREEPAPANTNRPALVHGVTGSGKTEVYLAAVAAVLAAGKRALVLVPEIALTPQTVERFAGRFPGRVAILHSGLPAGQRYDQWCGVRGGRFDVIVGSRSALFAPVAQVGLIVVDEEHEWTYKQQEPQPRYQTRDAAMRLAELTGARLAFGSATPDVTSYFRAQAGAYQLIELPDRVRPVAGGGRTRSLPSVQVVDLSRELREGNRSIFSRALATALDETLQRREQSILFLNRRGSASFVLCRDCGHVPSCRRCLVSLTFHAVTQQLLCHHCGRSRRVPAACPRCRGTRIRYLGLGTQRVEEEVARRFPLARVLRWDRDTARRAEDHRRMFEHLQHGDADVLIGTQMVAKGLDLPNVTLVGIVNADISLNLPDYYSGERAFQLLAQVAGRAGRRDRPGRVILQTYAPNHYAVRAVAAHDYRGFYEQEIDYRRRGGYPPFSRLTALVYAHSSPVQAQTESRRMGLLLRRAIEDQSLLDSEITGPVPCRAARVRGRWRWQLLLRSPRPESLLSDIAFPVGWHVDVDPQAFV